MGVKKWKTEKRETVANFWEITAIMAYFDKTETGEADKDPVMAIRDRALYGLMLFTGCRPDEARCATHGHQRRGQEAVTFTLGARIRSPCL